MEAERALGSPDHLPSYSPSELRVVDKGTTQKCAFEVLVLGCGEKSVLWIGERDAATPPLDGTEDPGPPPRDELGALCWITAPKVLRAVHRGSTCPTLSWVLRPACVEMIWLLFVN